MVYGTSGYRSSLAVALLEQQGMAPLADLDGGVTAWEDAGLATAQSNRADRRHEKRYGRGDKSAC